MKHKTITVSEGEKLGPIDWTYDFASHDGIYSPVEIENLKKVETWLAEGKPVEIYLYGMWTKVVDIGMYDGWPYWRPVPSICTANWLGNEWRAFVTCRWAAVRVQEQMPGFPPWPRIDSPLTERQ